MHNKKSSRDLLYSHVHIVNTVPYTQKFSKGRFVVYVFSSQLQKEDSFLKSTNKNPERFLIQKQVGLYLHRHLANIQCGDPEDGQLIKSINQETTIAACKPTTRAPAHHSVTRGKTVRLVSSLLPPYLYGSIQFCSFFHFLCIRAYLVWIIWDHQRHQKEQKAELTTLCETKSTECQSRSITNN